MESRNTGYLPQLDHLRFLAAALVIVFHVLLFLPAPDGTGFRIPLFEQGHVGVQLFMVISGFILGIITRNRKISTKRFYLNRFLRIYPLLVVVVALSYFCGNLETDQNVFKFIIALTPISNLSRLNYGTFGGQAWSIAVELQFYLLLPALLIFKNRYGLRYFLYLVGFLIALRTGVYFSTYTVHSLSYFSIFGALDLFIAGLVAGEYFDKVELRHPKLIFAASFLALNVLTYVPFIENDFSHVRIPAGRLLNGQSKHWLWIIWPDILSVLFVVLVVSYVHIRMSGRVSQFFARLGNYSYSMYLWHILVMMLAFRFVGVTFTGAPAYALATFVVVPVTIALSAISYHLIEEPFLGFRVRYIEDDVAAHNT